MLAEYTRLQNGDPFIEDAFLRSFHKFCPTCGKSFRGQGRGYCPTPDCRKILQVNRKRRKNLRKWLFKRVEGALSLGPPFEPALCGWAAREGYFDKFEAEVEPTNEEPATQEGTMDAEPAIQKPAAAIAQEVAEKIAMQEVIEETATAIAQGVCRGVHRPGGQHGHEARRREARLHRPRACQAAPVPGGQHV